MRSRRAALSSAERSAFSATICRQLRDLFTVQGKRVAIFLANELEPNLDALIGELQNVDAKVLAPHFRDEAKPWHEVAPGGDNIETVQLGKLKLRAPIEAPGCVAYGAGEVDVLLLPGLAFDESGNRLGQGGGWYDRVLSSAPAALKIGVCFDCQIADVVPHESHDVRVDFVVTEKRVIKSHSRS
jgi:5-formyltetrahydrofolate cyclo-ligase